MLIGAWQIPATGDVSFAAETRESVWRVVLPESVELAQAELDARANRMGHGSDTFRAAERRLMTFTHSLGNGATRSFAAPDQPEAALLRATLSVQAPAGGASFGPLGHDDLEDQSETSSQWQSWLAQVRQLVSTYARIETVQGGRIIGVTRVGWTGNFETIWETSHDLERALLHQRNVQTALGSRVEIVKLATVVGAGAADIAVKLVTPGMQILLLPAVWRFVRDVVDALQRQNLAAQPEATLDAAGTESAESR